MTKVTKMAARIDAAWMKGYEKMWYMALAEIVVDTLQEGKTITRETLLAELRRKQELASDERILVIAYDAAINAVENGLPPYPDEGT